MPMVLDPLAGKPDTSIATERRESHHEADVVIVGAGVAGSVLAVAFARQGRSVILLERSLKEPDRIVGELLQPGGLRSLEKLGLSECAQEIDAIPNKGYNVVYYGRGVEIQYPASQGKDGNRPEGKAFHHGKFIMRLRAAAMKEKNVLVVESTAVDVVRDEHTGQVLGVQCHTKGEKDFYFGHLTVIADGYASKFRKGIVKHQPVVKSRFFALELIDCELPLANYGHVILSKEPPTLLYQIGTRETRALIDVPENLASAASEHGGIKSHLRNRVLATLPKCTQPSFLAALEDGSSLRSMPNSYLPPSVNKTPGMILIGDSLNMRHPLTGGGMTVAFNDCVLVRDLLAPEHVPDLANVKLVLEQMEKFHAQRKSLGVVVNVLSMALYSLFAADDENLRILQRGCFQYFLQGGNCIDVPAGLISGLVPHPFVLIYHFFAVALLSVWITIAESPVYMWPIRFVQSIGVLYKACATIGPFLLHEFR